MKTEIYGRLVSFIVKPNEALKVSDPIQVHLIDHGAGRGRFVAVCYDMAWQAYFGGMGERSIEEFVRSCSPGYLANKMRGEFNVRTKRHEQYREQIVAAIQAALADESSSHNEESVK